MIIHSAHSPKEYLSALKYNMSGHMEFGIERFTGFFLGRLFYVTYHSGHEWNRKITNQKNAAMGYIKRTENGSEVHFLRFRGVLCPLVCIPTYLPILFMILYLNSQQVYTPDEFRFLMIVYHIMMAILAPVSALIESMTERSEDGRRTLLSMLIDPYDSLANYNNV